MGLWIPWQATLAVLGVVVGLTALVVTQFDSRFRDIRLRNASNTETSPEAGVSSTTTTAVEAQAVPKAEAPPITAAMESASATALSQTAPIVRKTTSPTVTTTTVAPTTTTVAPTTTTAAPGSAEIVIFGGGSSYGNGLCQRGYDDWEYIAGNCNNDMRGELIFNYDARRYPATAAAKVNLGVELSKDLTFCFRIINADTKAVVVGSEKCWVSTGRGQEVAYGDHHYDKIDNVYGPVKFPAETARYTPQVRLKHTSDGSPCQMSAPCMSRFHYGKVLIDW